MLTELRISNFALFDQLHLEFPKGFLALTGETGGGKSLLVDALVLLTGGRASAEHIRSDAEEAILEAGFSIAHNLSLVKYLRDRDLLTSDDQELIIRRVLSRSGKNKTYVNGSLAPLQVVQDIARWLIDIHSQHEQQSLLAVPAQLDVLDNFGEAQDLRGRYAKAYHHWKEKEGELNATLTRKAEQKDRQEFMEFQLQELEGANLQEGEEETLHQEYQRLKHARRIGELTNDAYQNLYEGEEAVLGNLRSILESFKELAEIDQSVEPWVRVGESASLSLQELTEDLRKYREELDYDPNRIGGIDDRLALIQRLKRKYQATVEQLIERKHSLQQELEGYVNIQDQIQGLTQEVAEACRLIEKLGKELSQKRRKAAKLFEQKIQDEFSVLRMNQVRFQVKMDSQSGIGGGGVTGMDKVEFVLSANPGEPLQPLAKVASGGELSRIMLAIKSVLAEADEVSVLIFDEVDTGIGGPVAAVVGERLRTLAHYHQVFCITHLPQIASKAGTHYLIEKSVKNKKTVTGVRMLRDTERQNEVARMLGGLEITPSTRDTATEMLQMSTKPTKRKPS
ncbi:MAG: DNA repair protein RecN [Nitrospirales bacterium]|nr:DNA repair protein RecN [Nitrospirales bacterium]